jgi:hypothetical protein
MIRTPAGTAAHFEWKLSIDEDPTPLLNHMIFVMSGAVGDADFVAQAVEHYNRKLRPDFSSMAAWPAENTARLRGSRRTYAPPAESVPHMRGRPRGDNPPPPDTAFDTDRWLLAARGRSSGPDREENFVMDARMNGADQPPFYPSVRRTAVSVQSIDRLVGTPQGLIEAQPYPNYVTGGFDTNNKGQIFLEVIRPVISLNPAAAKRPAAGGVAQPDTKVAALSRISGVVGGTPRTRIAALAQPPAGPMAASAALSRVEGFDFQEAAQGRFEPTKFFKLKVFGLDLLAGVQAGGLGDAPRLSEIVDYGAQDINKAQVRAAAAASLIKLGEAKAAILGGIAAFNRQIGQSGFTFQTLYPELWAAFSEAIGTQTSTGTVPAQLQVIAGDAELGEVAAAAMKIAAASKPLFAEISQTARDPVPPAVDDAIAQVIGEWKLSRRRCAGFRASSRASCTRSWRPSCNRSAAWGRITSRCCSDCRAAKRSRTCAPARRRARGSPKRCSTSMSASRFSPCFTPCGGSSCS